MKKTIITSAAILLLAAGCSSQNSSTTQNSPPTPQNTTTSTSNSTPSTGQTKTFTIQGGDYFFSPNTITVNKGDTVVINFQNVATDYPHNLVIDSYHVKTEAVGTGNSQTVQFVADNAGTFQMYCSIDGHRERGMVGTLNVK